MRVVSLGIRFEKLGFGNCYSKFFVGLVVIVVGVVVAVGVAGAVLCCSSLHSISGLVMILSLCFLSSCCSNLSGRLWLW